MIIREIDSDLKGIENDTALYEPTNFNNRADAIDFIDFHIIDRIDILLPQTKQQEYLNPIKERAEKLKNKLGKIDIDLFNHLRENIRAGLYKGKAFPNMVRTYLGNAITDTSQPGKIGYDNLDVFINDLLSNETLPEPTIALEPEMVFYQKTPAKIILQLAALANLTQDDVFVDLGSGLGQVTILMNLISGGTTKGIEYEPAYCNYAKGCVSRLNLTGIEFINDDALKADYSGGTVFFLYTPFYGRRLQSMLDILQKQAKNRTIRIFTYGPCSPYVALQGWLNGVNSEADDIYKLHEFRTIQY